MHPRINNALQDELNRQKEEFLAKGGKIEIIPYSPDAFNAEQDKDIANRRVKERIEAQDRFHKLNSFKAPTAIQRAADARKAIKDMDEEE